MNGKRILLLGFIVVMLVIIPVTVLLLQKQQTTSSSASKSTTLSLCSSAQPTTCVATQSVAAGQTVSFDIIADPNSINQIAYVNMTITYDATKLTPVAPTGVPGCTTAFCPNLAALPAVSQGPTLNPGSIAVVLTSTDNTNALKTRTRIATVTFQAKEATGPTTIAFADKPFVLSVNCGSTNPEDKNNCPIDQVTENVLNQANPATLTITGAATSPTPSPTATTSATPAVSQAPICSALNLDRAPSGTVPFSLTFTANGRDSDGTISKVTFDYGDGPVQDVTSAGGIGTNTVSVQTAHTYRTPGTFRATVTFTDSSSNVSAPIPQCTQTIVVTNGTGSTTTSSTSAESPIVVQPTTPIAKTTIAPTGPGNQLIGAGIAGAALTVLGTLLLLGL